MNKGGKVIRDVGEGGGAEPLRRVYDGVDPGIPIKPHTHTFAPSPNIELQREGWKGALAKPRSREVVEGEEGRGGPLNSCKLITINQALFFGRDDRG